MQTTFTLSSSLLRFLVVTRVALGFGIGLLVAERIPAERRRAVGVALAAIGGATTIPVIVLALRRRTQLPAAA